MLSFRWLLPGMRVKRWLALLLGGLTLLALGIVYTLIDVYDRVELEPGSTEQIWVSLATFQFVPQWLRALLFASVGLLAIGFGLYGLWRSLIDAERSARSGRLLEKVDRRRRRRSEAKIVAIGGGTGLSTMLRGLKLQTSNITAIVTVADDGGSSGRLRQSLGVHPPGDFRQCIAALADTEPLMESLFQYRFGQGELGGHAFGNLFIVAMTGITGSFESALRASSRVLAVSGRIVPSTLEHVTLYAELADDQVMRGESKVPKGESPIRRVFIEPSTPPAFPEAVSAILDADLVVIGPGSLYTSILPNLLVPDIVNAIAASRAAVAYVVNVATQPGETDGYDLEDHLEALYQHVPSDLLDFVLANRETALDLPADSPVEIVKPRFGARSKLKPPQLVTSKLVDPKIPTHHDPIRLAEAVVQLARRRSGEKKTR